jgi:hypothetical protein
VGESCGGGTTGKDSVEGLSANITDILGAGMEPVPLPPYYPLPHLLMSWMVPNSRWLLRYSVVEVKVEVEVESH